MPTAEELLMQVSRSGESIEVLTVDLDTRIISIPATIRLLGVESDDDVKRLHFSVPRYYGEFDLSEFKIRINFKNSRSSGDLYPADDIVTTDDDKITFSWLVDRTAFNQAGDVEFSVCMQKYDDNGIVVKELNTAIASLPVLKGLETSKAVVESNPSAFDAVLFRLYAIEAANGMGQNGYYTIAKVEEYAHGTKVTVVDRDGTTIAVIKNGIDGYTPIKGVDYWTNEEQTSMETDVMQNMKNYIDNWSPNYKPVTLSATKWSGNIQTDYRHRWS